MSTPLELVHLSRDAIPPSTLGARLRAARLSRNITLEQVAAQTKINPGFFRDLERNDLSKWPASQFYRESYLRGYAEAVGLDPAEVVEAFRSEFVPDERSAAPAAPSPRRLTPVTIPIILAMTFAIVYSLVRFTTPGEGEAAGAYGTSAAPAAPVTSQPPPQNDVPAVAPAQQAAPEPVAPAEDDIDQIEGELIITSTPPGAHVVVNGIGRGPTPTRVRFLPAGSYTVRFLLTGHVSVTRRAQISAKRLRVPVSATLEPAPLPGTHVAAGSPAPDASLDRSESDEKESNEVDAAQSQ